MKEINRYSLYEFIHIGHMAEIANGESKDSRNATSARIEVPRVI